MMYPLALTSFQKLAVACCFTCIKHVTSAAPQPSGVPYKQVQILPETPGEALEDHQGYMVEEKGNQAVEACKRCLDTEGGE